MVARLLLGKDQWGTYCLRTSKPGRDVWTSNPATAPDAFTFNSDWDRVEEIHQAGTATLRPVRMNYLGIDTSGAPYTDWDALVFPSLGYVPMFSVMMHRDGYASEMEQVTQDADGTGAMRASRFVPWISYERVDILRMSPNANGSYITLPRDLGTELIFDYLPQQIDYVLWKMPGG